MDALYMYKIKDVEEKGTSSIESENEMNSFDECMNDGDRTGMTGVGNKTYATPNNRKKR